MTQIGLIYTDFNYSSVPLCETKKIVNPSADPSIVGRAPYESRFQYYRIN